MPIKQKYSLLKTTKEIKEKTVFLFNWFWVHLSLKILQSLNWQKITDLLQPYYPISYLGLVMFIIIILLLCLSWHSPFNEINLIFWPCPKYSPSVSDTHTRIHYNADLDPCPIRIQIQRVKSWNFFFSKRL